MGAQGLSLELIDSEHGHEVRLVGELDLDAAPAIASFLQKVAHSTVTVDLSGLTFLDACGLSALLGAKSRIERRGDGLRFVNASGTVRLLFELCDLANLLED